MPLNITEDELKRAERNLTIFELNWEMLQVKTIAELKEHINNIFIRKQQEGQPYKIGSIEITESTQNSAELVGAKGYLLENLVALKTYSIIFRNSNRSLNTELEKALVMQKVTMRITLTKIPHKISTQILQRILVNHWDIINDLNLIKLFNESILYFIAIINGIVEKIRLSENIDLDHYFKSYLFHFYPILLGLQDNTSQLWIKLEIINNVIMDNKQLHFFQDFSATFFSFNPLNAEKIKQIMALPDDARLQFKSEVLKKEGKELYGYLTNYFYKSNLLCSTQNQTELTEDFKNMRSAFKMKRKQPTIDMEEAQNKLEGNPDPSRTMIKKMSEQDSTEAYLKRREKKIEYPVITKKNEHNKQSNNAELQQKETYNSTGHKH